MQNRNQKTFGKEGLTLYQYVIKRVEKDVWFRDEIIGEFLDLLDEKDGCKTISETMEDWGG